MKIQLVLETPRPTHVILKAGATNGGQVLVGVDKKLDLTLSPPKSTESGQGYKGANVLTRATCVIEDAYISALRELVGAPPLSVQITDTVGDFVP